MPLVGALILGGYIHFSVDASFDTTYSLVCSMYTQQNWRCGVF